MPYVSEIEKKRYLHPAHLVFNTDIFFLIAKKFILKSTIFRFNCIEKANDIWIILYYLFCYQCHFL